MGNSRRLEGKVALVTGGARGIGAATARRFVAEGARVAISDVLEAEGDALAAELGDQAMFCAHDVADPEAWAAVVVQAEERFGTLDVLVNNAGTSGEGSPLIAETQAGYDKLVAINQTGVFHGIRAVVPALRRAGGGSIVNVSSIAGLVAWPGLGAYAATKFAVVGLTKVAATELGAFGIRVNCVHPGVIDTPMVSAADAVRGPLDQVIANLAIARMGRPEEVASALLFFASDDSTFCTGASLAVDGGWTAV